MEFLGARYALPLVITDSRDRFAGRTTNRLRRSFAGAAQQWLLEITLEPDGAGARQFAARLQAHQAEHGMRDVFRVPMPQHWGNPIIDDATITVFETADAGASEVRLAKTSTGRLEIPAGQFVRVGASRKIHMVLEDVVFANVAARPTVKVYPDLVREATAGQRLAANPVLRVQWGDQTDWGMTQYDRDGIFNYYAYFDEALE